jgi:hypothetical protein
MMLLVRLENPKFAQVGHQVSASFGIAALEGV